MARCTNVPEPKSLNDALDFAGALSLNQGLKDSVGTALERRVAKALGLRDPPKSVADGDSTTISGNFHDVLTKLNDLRNSIVDDSHLGSYGTYETLKQPSHDASCVESCVERILGVLARLYCTLNYFYFKVDSDNGTLGGGNWNSDDCNASSGYGTGTLGAWLKDANKLPTGVPSASGSDVKLLPGGYDGNVSDKMGSALMNTLGKLINDSGGGAGGCLQYFLMDVFAITPFYSCDATTCLLFLRWFCCAVTGESRFDDALNESERSAHPNVKAPCTSLSKQLKLFTAEQSDSNALFTALFQSSVYRYREEWKGIAFLKCIEWLKGILPPLIASLQSLSGDAKTWTYQCFEGSRISGPFAYGFSLSDQWSSQWNDDCKTQIPAAINKLNDSLTDLQHILKQHFNGSGSSAGSIAGSLFGTAAVGGVGTAVALNVGGGTTALKGAIGIFK
ncbi:secreted antigen 1 [Babesia caballi]|uniref:Secreted antigen 1 n=1 Tax=Babesia caballi TaxID=5871 RepID=A0AAV4LSM4_BABCB|nr:secreted antigen 1 [Babesia caballi]